MDEPRRRWRILVVDDDPALIAALTEGLELLGHHDVVPARDGTEGLTRFFEVRPDCIVVDVRMPGLNGYQLVRALRGDVATANVPIIMLSALVRDPDQVLGLLSGADAYLVKPVKMVDLIQAIEHAVQLSAEERATQLRSLTDDASTPKEE